MTNISWTTETWNPIVGCSIVSKGCTNCYAMRMANRLGFIFAGKKAAGRHLDGVIHDAMPPHAEGAA